MDAGCRAARFWKVKDKGQDLVGNQFEKFSII